MIILAGIQTFTSWSEMNKYLRIIFKVLKISTIVLLLLFFLVSILIQTPKVQTWLVGKVTNSLSESLHTKVTIDKVDLDFFKTFVLEGIFIEDQQADTLLYAQKLKTDIGIFSLFGKEIFLNTIKLESTVVQISKKENDSLFNFQFIIDAFSSDEPKAKKKDESSAAWTFGIGNVIIENTRFRMADENSGGFELKTKVGSLNIDAEELDFGNNKIALSDFKLSESVLEFTMLKGEKVVKNDSSKLVFPSFGWDISSDALQLKNNQFKLTNLNYERQADIVDYNFLNLEDISLNISNLSLNDTSYNLNILQASLVDHSGFQVNNLSAEFNINNKIIAAQKLELETQQTSLKGAISLSFDDFGDLADFMEKVKLEASFEPSQVAYRDLTKIVAALQNIPFVKTDIDEKIDLNGKLVLRKNNISFENFDSKIGNIFSLQANGSIAQLTSDPLFDLDIKKLRTDYNSFMRLTKGIPLPEGLAKLGKIDFTGQIKGTVSNLNGKRLNLITESATRYKGDLNIYGLPDIEKTIFKADAENLIVSADDIEAFSGTQFPDILDSLGLIKFQGKFEGTIYKFDVTGIFQTDAGEMQSDLAMDFETDYQNAKYDGIVKLENFDLSKLLGEPFGQTSFDLKTKGSGLNINDLDLIASGDIPVFNYKNYTYQNLSLNGAFYKKRFEGVAKAADENLQFDFQGMVDLNDSLPDMEMTLNVDTINLKALNFYEKELGFSGDLEANLKGNNLDNIVGIASLQNFKIVHDSVFYSTDSTISLEAQSSVLNQKAIHFRSEFMDANITGEFVIADFRQSIIEFIDGFFPIEDLILKDSSSQQIEEADEQDIAFDFQFNDLSSVAQLFLSEFTAADTALIIGSFNSEKKRLKLNGSFPNLVYGAYEVDSISISSTGNAKRLETIISLEQFESGGVMNFPLISFKTLFANDTLNFGLNILGVEESGNLSLFKGTPVYSKIDTTLDIKGNVSFENETYALSFLPEFILNNYVWEIEASNKIEFTSNDLTVSNLDFLKENQKITINSFDTAPTGDFKPIEIRISDFNLEELSKMLGMTENKIGGMVKGDLILKEPKTNLHYNTAILLVDSHCLITKN